MKGSLYCTLLLPILLLLSAITLKAQENQQYKYVSLNFTDVILVEVLGEIERQTNVHFYYDLEWVKTKRTSIAVSRATVESVLEILLDETSLNYFPYGDGKIILTKNNLIYNSLPEAFFGATAKNPATLQTESETYGPILLDKQAPQITGNIETVSIGREGSQNADRTYLLSGYVTEGKTKQPLQDLSVRLTKGRAGTTTDESGFYQLKLPQGENYITFSSIGIQSSTKRVIVYNDGNLNVAMSESVEYLDEVVVSADANKNVEEALTGSTSLVVEETKNIPLVLGERDVLKVATTLPGISTAGEGAAGFNVRGGSTDQNLILLDDAVIYNPSHFFGIFQAINPFTTQDVQIYTGGIPAEFGGRLSSVFDITSKDADTENFSGEAAIGPVTSSIALEVPVVKEKSGLLVGGRSTYSDWILRSLDDPDLQNSQASFYDVIAKYSHTINENNKVKAMGYYSADNFSITSDSLFGYSNRLFSINWEHKFNEKNTGRLSVANSNYNFNIGFDGNSNTDFDLGFTIDETEYKLRMKYLHGPKHNIDYGVMAKFYRTEPGYLRPMGAESEINEINIAEERALESAIYVSDSYKFSDKLLLDLGFRYSFFASLGPREERIYEANSPQNAGTLVRTENFDNGEIATTYGGAEVRIAGRYLLQEDLSLKASYNRTFQYIHRLSNNTTISPIDTWKLSDNNIQPQLGNQYSAGIFKNIDGNAYELSIESYYKTADNILDFKVGSDLLLNETVETETLQGDGQSYGVEFLARKNNGILNGWLSYTYSRSFLRLDSEFAEERVNAGEFFPTNFDRPHDISAILNYKFTKRLSLSANFIYQTGRPVTFPVGRYNFNNAEFVFYSDRNAFRIPDFYRLDLGFNIEGNHKKKKLAHSFWNISVYNVLGRNNPFSVFFVTENGELQALQSSIFAIPVPTITYNFKF